MDSGRPRGRCSAVRSGVLASRALGKKRGAGPLKRPAGVLPSRRAPDAVPRWNMASRGRLAHWRSRDADADRSAIDRDAGGTRGRARLASRRRDFTSLRRVFSWFRPAVGARVDRRVSAVLSRRVWRWAGGNRPVRTHAGDRWRTSGVFPEWPSRAWGVNPSNGNTVSRLACGPGSPDGEPTSRVHECPGEGSNLHSLAATWPSTMRVCQFRHPGAPAWGTKPDTRPYRT